MPELRRREQEGVRKLVSRDDVVVIRSLREELDVDTLRNHFDIALVELGQMLLKVVSHVVATGLNHSGVLYAFGECRLSLDEFLLRKEFRIVDLLDVVDRVDGGCVRKREEARRRNVGDIDDIGGTRQSGRVTG